MAGMRVELLWWSGCPSHAKARVMLERAMMDLGMDPATIESVQLFTDEDAVRERFTGSPTIRVNGTDIVPPEDGDPSALTCRLYFRRDGRPSPLPDPEDIREALQQSSHGH